MPDRVPDSAANNMADSTVRSEALQKNHAERRNGHKTWAACRIKDADSLLRKTIVDHETLQQIAVIKESLVSEQNYNFERARYANKSNIYSGKGTH